MNNYIEVKFIFPTDNGILISNDSNLTIETATDVMSAILADYGFESFVQEGNCLFAYIAAERFNRQLASEILTEYPFDVDVKIEVSEIEGCDWNAEWEKNYFKPIVIDNRCCIHSSFHTDYPECDYDIVIDPKMAFGTGHHATTSQIIRQLLEIDLSGKHVIDMGTGTGILAILAVMRGASQVVAVEIDPAAVENARENMALNDCEAIDLRLGDASKLSDAKADVFIANINRNIILNDMGAYVDTMHPDALLILSGFYESDMPMLLERAETLGLKYVRHTSQSDGWTCLVLQKVK